MNFLKIVENEMKKSEKILISFPWEDTDSYANWLAQTYYMVSHSTRLVALAGALIDLEKPDLHARFIDHAKEERGHEIVCISDIKQLGKKLSDFDKFASSQAMYQVQYYWIQHKNPISFFGYTYALEMLACKFGPIVFSRVEKAHGSKCSKFLKLHSEADLDHMNKANEMILKLSDRELLLAGENLGLSCQLYRNMLTEITNKKINPTEKNKAA